jgi:RNA polymerase sigma factor (sigma-70 family)
LSEGSVPITRDSERAALSAALARVAEGDRSALNEVYRRTSAKLFGVCLRIFPEKSDAEDALQDAFVNVWQKAGSFDPARASPVTWLVTLTRNRAIDRLRASGKRMTAPIEAAFDIADDSPDAEACLIASDERDRIAQCMDTLASGDAIMIRTAFFEGATYTDIADRASLPLGTVKSRIRRALMKLKTCLA